MNTSKINLTNENAVPQLIRLLELAAYKIWDGVLVGSPCAKAVETFNDMQNPQPGDLVIETSTLWWAKMRMGEKMEPRGISGIGYLRSIEWEPFWTAEQWVEQGGGDDPIPTEKTIYIQLFDGTEQRWTNADVLKIPIVDPNEITA